MGSYPDNADDFYFALTPFDYRWHAGFASRKTRLAKSSAHPASSTRLGAAYGLGC